MSKNSIKQFEEWLDPQAISYVVYETLSEWGLKPSLENAQEVWLDVLENELADAADLTIESIKDRLSEERGKR